MGHQGTCQPYTRCSAAKHLSPCMGGMPKCAKIRGKHCQPCDRNRCAWASVIMRTASARLPRNKVLLVDHPLLASWFLLGASASSPRLWRTLPRVTSNHLAIVPNHPQPLTAPVVASASDGLSASAATAARSRCALMHWKGTKGVAYTSIFIHLYIYICIDR